MTDQSKIQLPTASRRRFLQGAGAASLGLVVGFHWAPRHAMAQKAAAGEPKLINAFIRIAPDNTVTVLSKHLEMGQARIPASPPSWPRNWMPTGSRCAPKARRPM